jgi:hypothetical protein
MSLHPHDALFRWAFEDPAAAAALLRELLPPAVCEAIAWETLESAGGSYVDRALADRHSDLLFAARLQTREPARAYLLLEHQSTDDPVMPLRMLGYQTRLWERLLKVHAGEPWLSPILGVLVSHPPGGWASARAFEELLAPEVLAVPGLAALVPRCSMVIEDLTARSDAELRARALPAFQQVALWLLRDAREPARLLRGFDGWGPTILRAGRDRCGADALAVLCRYLVEVLDPVHFEMIRAKLVELGTQSREISMTMAEFLREQGRTEGLRRGRQQGLRAGRRAGQRAGRIATLRSLLVYKHGPLDAASEARLKAATPAELERYLRRVLTARSLAAVFEG